LRCQTRIAHLWFICRACDSWAIDHTSTLKVRTWGPTALGLVLHLFFLDWRLRPLFFALKCTQYFFIVLFHKIWQD
jgi:hypothetical protein